jgi:FtsH-binding integral membrane protein
MSNDPNKPGGPAKTIMGWAPSQSPPGQPPAAQPPGAPPAAPPWQQQPPAAQPPAAQPPWQQQPPPAAPPWQQQPPQPQPWQPPPQQQAYVPPAPQPWQPPPQQQAYQPPQPQPWQQPAPQPWQPPPQQQAYQPPQPYTPPAQPFNSPPPSHQAGSAAPELRRDATAGVSDRMRFIRLTYIHLFAAILVFAGLEYVLMKVPVVFEKVSMPILEFALGGQYNWGIVLLAFMVVGWVADYWASHTTSRALQYVGLTIYVIAEALIFLPLLVLAEAQAAEYLAKTGKEAHIIRDAAILTLAIFGALTASVFFTKKDFSFMGGALAILGAAATVLVFLSIAFGFTLGIVFSVAMVILAAGYVLYYTSQVFAHYKTSQYVAAALALFASVALMFWYVIRILMKLRE